MRKKLIILGVFTCLSFMTGWSQDTHFSQFYASPLSLNPSMTGHYDADWRFMNIYRTQWGAIDVPYQTIGIGLDRQFYIRDKKFSGGFFFSHDNSGVGSLNVDKIFLSIGYHAKVKNSFLHFGIQGGVVLKSISYDKLTFLDQWNHDEGDFSLATSEENNGKSMIYPDLNFGVLWSKNGKKVKPEIGISAFHLTNPKENFSDTITNNKLPLRYVGYASIRFEIKEKFFIKPYGLYMYHKTASDMVIGSNFGIYIPENKIKLTSIFIGAMFRNNITTEFDASIFVIGAEFKHMEIGISYDVNVSSLEPATSNRGALEISLIFTSANSKVSKITVPCDRY